MPGRPVKHGPMINPAEILRRISNLVRLGSIAQVDHDAARVRVYSGELTTGWLPWIESRAGSIRTWSPPAVGEQVVIFSPGGDMAAAVVLTGIYQAAYPAPSDGAGVWHAVFPDGAVLKYDHEAQHLTANLPGSAEITAVSGITINADTTINGSVAFNGNSVTHNGKNIGDDHGHSGVMAGSDISGGPV